MILRGECGSEVSRWCDKFGIYLGATSIGNDPEPESASIAVWIGLGILTLHTGVGTVVSKVFEENFPVLFLCTSWFLSGLSERLSESCLLVSVLRAICVREDDHLELGVFSFIDLGVFMIIGVISCVISAFFMECL